MRLVNLRISGLQLKFFLAIFITICSLIYFVIFLRSGSHIRSSTHAVIQESLTPQPQNTRRRRSNVLLVLADDLRPDLGVYAKHDETGGGVYNRDIHTPNLDAFARTGLVVNRAYCQYALCSPSRTSFMTGRRPDTTKVYELSSYWRQTTGNFTTIPQYFKENGYHAVSVGKIFHTNDKLFAFGDAALSWSEAPFRVLLDNTYSQNKSWDAVDNAKPETDVQHANYAVEWLEKFSDAADSNTQQRKPFFMALGFVRPHLPFIAPDKFFELYPKADIKLASQRSVPRNLPRTAWQAYGELRSYGDVKALNITGEFNTSIPDWKALELRRAYYASVSFIDALFGQVMATLERLDLSRDTIVLFTSDHGFHLGERNEWCKHANFEEAVRVPFMLRIPGVTHSGSRTDALVELVDIFPTLVEAAGLPAVPVCPADPRNVTVCHEGHSVMDVARGRRAGKNAVFFQYRRFPKMGYGIRTKDYKYVRWVMHRPSNPTWMPSDSDQRELYDLRKDPGTNNNVAGSEQYTKEVIEMDRLLRTGWRNAWP